MDVDRDLLVIVVHVGKETLKNVLLDERSKVNIITKEKHIWLRMQIPLRAPYWLFIIDQNLVQWVVQIWNVKIHIHEIPNFITMTNI